MIRWQVGDIDVWARAEHRAQSGLDIVDHGEFLLDQANHLRADRHPAAGGAQRRWRESGRSRTSRVAHELCEHS